MAQLLPADQWLQVVTLAPLVSIDLIVRNASGEILLGWRSNRPAQHTWFVPGGVIRKTERLDDAFDRIVFDELGIHLPTGFQRGQYFQGLYEHHYPDNFAGVDGVPTHYVVQAHQVSLLDLGIQGETQWIEQLPKAQHTRYCWMTIPQLLAHVDVHPHVKAYVRA
ncbi:MAG TPA: NUDIX domain-containing protein [Limnobacter sp.]|uniref:GDP-mannose mannosyl hydrolase n=1 Tax=Limnobacter sp. TaxID=2003368 RepID=UPI002EDB1DE9